MPDSQAYAGGTLGPEMIMRGIRFGVLTLAVCLVLAGSAQADEERALEQVLRALVANPPQTAAEYVAWLEELHLVGPSAVPYMRAIARRYVRGPGFEDEKARAFLGDRRFAREIPEAITFRQHPFLQTVEAAAEKRWFAADERDAWRCAEAAWQQSLHHFRRLERDLAYRAADQAFANLTHDPQLKGLYLTFLQSEPYALTYVSSEPLATADRETARRALQEQARTLQPLYRSFLRQFGGQFGMRDLAMPFGGRPDFRASVRSYEDGIPLLVFVFGDRPAFASYLGVRAGWGRPDRLEAYVGFNGRSGRLTVWSAGDDAAARASKTAASGTEQLLYWFTRQRNKWRTPVVGGDCFSIGFRGWFAGAADRLLAHMKGLAAAFRERDQPYPLLPVSALLSLNSPQETMTYATEAGFHAQLGVMLFEEQSWALTKMLRDGCDGRYRSSWLEWMNAVLDRQTGHGMGRSTFAKVFRLRHETDWEEIEADWQSFVEQELLGSPVRLLKADD